MGIDRKYGKVTTQVQSIPDDEPVFIIRAKDKASIAALLRYAEAAYHEGASQQFVDDVIASMRRFATWQDDNPASVKTPD